MKRLACLLAVIMVAACSQSEKAGDGELVTVKVDLEAPRSSKEISDFQKRFSIRLVPLENLESFVIGDLRLSRIMVSGEDVFLVDGVQNIIFRYNTNGKFVKIINRQGRGPQEYTGSRDFAISNNKLCIFSSFNIHQYDFNGNFIKAFPVEMGDRFSVDDSGNVVVASRYTSEYMLTVYNDSGEKVATCFPSELTDMQIVRWMEYSLGAYDGGVYVANYFDPTIYYLKNGEIKPMFQFDFGANSLPASFFMGTPEAIMNNFTSYRENRVMALNYATVTDNWVIFAPEKFRDFYVVYYDRRMDTYMTNRGFESPYSTFFGKFYAPWGCTDNGEFYSAINAHELREMIVELAEKDPDYLKRYDFLQGIDPVSISDDDNPWLVFYTLK